RLHYQPGTINTVKARLKQLVDREYLQTTKRSIGAPPYSYTLTAKGLRYLKSLGMDTSAALRPNDRGAVAHAPFIEHALELNDVIISAALLAPRHPDAEHYIHSFIPEHVLKRRPYTGQQQGRRAFTIIPDAVFDFRRPLPDGRHRYTPVLLEHD